MELVCFVILHFKDLVTTDCCVQSVLAMDQQERIRIVIVDNDIKETREKRLNLVQKYQRVSNIYVIQIVENGGFSYANNKGYIFAKEKLGASFIVVLNNDIEFTQRNFIEKLDASYKKYHSHILGPDIVKNKSKEHQNPMDIRIRTRDEAEYTIRMNSLALKWYLVLYPILYLQDRYVQKKNVKDKKRKENFNLL